MAIVHHCGRLTEIVAELLPRQTATNRSDLTKRVFDMKQQYIFSEIKYKNIFGRYLVCVLLIECQKLRLSHMH